MSEKKPPTARFNKNTKPFGAQPQQYTDAQTLSKFIISSEYHGGHISYTLDRTVSHIPIAERAIRNMQLDEIFDIEIMRRFIDNPNTAISKPWSKAVRAYFEQHIMAEIANLLSVIPKQKRDINAIASMIGINDKPMFIEIAFEDKFQKLRLSSGSALIKKAVNYVFLAELGAPGSGLESPTYH